MVQKTNPAQGGKEITKIPASAGIFVYLAGELASTQLHLDFL